MKSRLPLYTSIRPMVVFALFYYWIYTLEFRINLKKSFCRADRNTNGPADFKLGERFALQINHAFEFFEVIFSCFKAVLDARCYFAGFFALQPQTNCQSRRHFFPILASFSVHESSCSSSSSKTVRTTHSI